MTAISHREMRNNSAEVLRRVERGETLQITNRGRVVATLAPATRPVIDELLAEGGARPAARSVTTLRDIVRSRSDLSTAEIIDDIRGQR